MSYGRKLFPLEGYGIVIIRDEKTFFLTADNLYTETIENICLDSKRSRQSKLSALRRDGFFEPGERADVEYFDFS